MINTREKEFRNVSKLKVGETPFSVVSISPVSGLKIALYAKSSSPMSVKIKMKRNIKIVKLVMSLMLLPIVSIINSNLFHCLASLNILRRRNPLNKVTRFPLIFLSRKTFATVKSIRLPTTMMLSKILNQDPLKNYFIPVAVSKMIISNVKMRVKAILSFSRM